MTAILEQSVSIERPQLDEGERLKRASLLERAQSITINDAESNVLACEVLKGAVVVRKLIVERYARSKKLAHELHKEITGNEKKDLEPVERAEALLKSKIAQWGSEQQRLARIEQQRLEAEARAREVDERLATAIEAEQDGASEAEVKSILARAAAIVIPTAPAPQKVEGISTAYNYSAEVVDLKELVKAAVQDNTLLCYLEVNQTALNGAARTQKEAMRIPGVRLIKTPRVAVRV